MNITQTLKRDWPVLLMVLLPFLLSALYWDSMPERVPIHWNLEGKVDNYGDKKYALLIIPLLNLGLYFLFLYLPKLDPKQNIQYFTGTLQKLKFILHGFLLLLFIFIIYSTMNPQAPSERLVPLAGLGLIMVLGNYMGKMKPNYFIGVRTPWTLQSDEIWLRTHLFTGRVWTGVSLVMLLVWFLLPAKTFAVLMIPYIILIGLLPVVYSYYLFRKSKAVKN